MLALCVPLLACPAAAPTRVSEQVRFQPASRPVYRADHEIALQGARICNLPSDENHRILDPD